MKSLRKRIGADLCGGNPASDRTHFPEGGDEYEEPPPSIGHNERRIQLRVYTIWSNLLGEDKFPTLAEFVSHIDPVLALRSVLFDFTSDRGDPLVAFLGDELAAECGVSAQERCRLSAIAERSLVAQIAEQYLPTIVQPAPIGFEAELINQRGRTILYRGILLPFSEYGATIDSVLGVISWKEVADQETTDELLHELGLAIESPAKTTRGEAAIDRQTASYAADGSAGELRAIEPCALATIGGGKFAGVVIRGRGRGDPAVLGEVPRYSSLFERAARRLFG